MKNVFFLFALLASVSVEAQYYYNDIVATREINDKMKAYVAARVQSVTATGYDERGAKTPDFNEWQEVQSNGSVLKITTRNGQTVSRSYYQFDDKTRVINARDSATAVETTTTYRYDNSGNLVNIKTSVKYTEDSDFNKTEERQWVYNDQGKISKMWKMVNGSDSTEYSFTLDEKGNVEDEMLFHRGGVNSPVYYYYNEDKIYYYYDARNRVSDVVRYNKKAKKLLPDFILDYDDNNHIIQRKTTVSAETLPDYFIWRYGFDERGLKTKEILYNKYSQLKGRIEYAYSFAQ